MSLPLFVFKGGSFACPLSSWFIVSDAHNPIITLTRDLLFEYWRDYDYLIHYFMFHMFFKIAAGVYKDNWDGIPIMSNNPPHEMQRAMFEDWSEERMQYFAGISDFHKMTYKFDASRVKSSSILQHVIDSYK